MSEAETVEYDENYSEADEDRLNGATAGQQFAQRHIFGKIDLFVKVYREKGWSEEFISGFIDGINDATGATICLNSGEESVTEEVDNAAEGD